MLPADAITIDGRLYLFAMVNRGLHNVLWTEINYSDDCGDTWHDAGPDARRLGSHNDGHQQLVTWEHDPDSGWVYVITSAFNRRENAYLYRVRADDLLDRSAWHPWTGGWFSNDPVPLLPAGTTVGEMSLRRVENRWVFSYFESSSGTIRVKVLNNPTDDFGRSADHDRAAQHDMGIASVQSARRLHRRTPSASCTAATSCPARRCATCILWSATGTPPTAPTGPTARCSTGTTRRRGCNSERRPRDRPMPVG